MSKPAPQSVAFRRSNKTLGRREALEDANRTRKISAAQIIAWFYSAYAETKRWPLVKEAAEFGVSEKTVRRAVKEAGIILPREWAKKLDRL